MTMDLDFFAGHHPVARPALLRPAKWLLSGLFRSQGVKIRFENPPRPSSQRVIFACNATHQYDLLPIRWCFDEVGLPITTLSKGKNYHGLPMRTFCVTMGSVPIVSRGYIIAMDFRAVFGRSPSDEEYRALRSQIDADTPLRQTPALQTMATQARSILGRQFDPDRETYGEAARALYTAMMARTIELCRQANDLGTDLQMFPQGSSSTRLSEGHIGAVQLSHALGIPIVPVGVNGCLEVFPTRKKINMARGEVVLTAGEPWMPPLSELPSDFQAFDPGHERKNRDILATATGELMERINGLLWPQYRWADDRQSDGARGVKRFV